MALIERGGAVRAFHVPDVKRATLLKIVADNVALGARVMTDEYGAYTGLAPFYVHQNVTNGIGTYVVGDTHTNTAEGFFSLLKRGLIGIYHYVSRKHLTRYLNEFSFRYNLRSTTNGTPFTSLLNNCSGRLTYKALIQNVQ